MKGVATFEENEVITMTPEIKSTNTVESLSNAVKNSLQQYFAQLDGQTPSKLYDLVLAAIEKPLIEMALIWSGGNQSKAAKILNISRGTLRKKMAIYGIK